MALNATIFKAAVQISDMDRGYYHEHALTIARHPSETDERMMVRLLAFCLHASEALSFGKGLSTDDEPDLWEKDLTGAIVSWIDVGQPDDKRIRKACGRANEVFVYSYGVQGARVWWEKIGGELERVRNVTVIRLPAETRDAGEARRAQYAPHVHDPGSACVACERGDESVEMHWRRSKHRRRALNDATTQSQILRLRPVRLPPKGFSPCLNHTAPSTASKSSPAPPRRPAPFPTC